MQLGLVSSCRAAGHQMTRTCWTDDSLHSLSKGAKSGTVQRLLGQVKQAPARPGCQRETQPQKGQGVGHRPEPLSLCSITANATNLLHKYQTHYFIISDFHHSPGSTRRNFYSFKALKKTNNVARILHNVSKFEHLHHFEGL